MWQIESSDTIDTALWLPLEQVVACPDVIINTDTGDSVRATEIRGHAPQTSELQSRRPATSLSQLEGAIIVADDGQFLGVITTNCFDPKALCNKFGTYGNKFSTNSILNQFGTYGNQFSNLSPYNRFTVAPPQIFKGGKFVAYVTKNAMLSPRIDPDLLIAYLTSK